MANEINPRFLLACIAIAIMACSSKASSDRCSTSGSKVRLHLIRHGESEANKQGIFAGQSDSLLTPAGREEARSLGRLNSRLRETDFWRLYSSDLSRAHETILHILQSAGRHESISALHLSKTLRERSYGPRQGMSRKLSVEEAMKVWASRNEDPPAWETDNDLWIRARKWILDVLEEIQTLGRLLESTNILREEEKTTAPKVYNVLVTSHAGIIRVILLNLVGHDRLVELGARWDASRNNRLVIPNTSLTILEIDTQKDQPLEDVKVVELTNAQHLGIVNQYDD